MSVAAHQIPVTSDRWPLARDRVTASVAALVLAVLVWGAIRYLVFSWQLVWYPFEYEDTEGSFLAYSQLLRAGQPIYVMLYAAAIVFFCFFYTALVFNSRETADNLKKSGAFIPGIRPGDQTARYIDKILVRLTLAGAVYITFVCLLPEFLILKYNVPFYFGGTSLLIIVVVTMDFMAQVQNYLMSQQYESLLKKANFKTSLGG